MKLAGRSAIITGASQGLGYEIAKMFILEGAHVMLCARNAESLASAQQALAKIANPQVKVLAKVTDVSDPEQMHALAAYALKEFGKIDILVANAGIYGTKGPIEEIDWDEWSRAIDINLKGTVLQCISVLPHFKKQHYGKIIILSGGGATKPMPNLSAYAASKAGVVRFAETLAEEVKDFNIDVNTVAPGALNTRLLDELLAAGPEKVGKEFYDQSLKQKENGGTSFEVGASLCVFLASSVSDGITGRLLSAVWDPWKNLPEYKEELKNSDIYTLRRIVPKDRAKTWDECL
ncbi:MAG: SDR family NAD(P)-dependent oxidoreductase [Gammaproteobacteria bacterium]|nr:SDR family NAD(P)-dependent oxidoreductase [Gammaproteobacteria bacterium]